MAHERALETSLASGLDPLECALLSKRTHDVFDKADSGGVPVRGVWQFSDPLSSPLGIS